MLGNDLRIDFYQELETRLISCGYTSHKEGIFTKDISAGIRDWLSVTGNSYFYIVSTGVVFTSLSTKMRDNMPAQLGIAPLDGISPSLIPFVSSLATRYLDLPERGKKPSASSVLTLLDADDLAKCLCASLPSGLAPFHDLKHAIAEVESTLDTGGMKAFLLLLAYIEIQREDMAADFAQKTSKAFKSASARRYYDEFVRRLQIAA